MSRLAFSIRFRSNEVHTIRNFGEDLARTMRDRRLGSVAEIDNAIDEITGTLSSRRELGEWRQLIRKMLEQHALTEVATVVEP